MMEIDDFMVKFEDYTETVNEIETLVAKLNEYTRAYDEGHPIIKDSEWDDMYFYLKDLEEKTGYIIPESPTQSISYETVYQLNKVKHDHNMLSLDKTKNIEDFFKYFNGKDYVLMPKLDGLTCSLEYQYGVLIKAETRGNGIVGEDILHNAKVIKNIPKRINYKGILVVDGEIICKYRDFKKFENDYANPRNFASGSIRLLDSKECKNRDLSFVVWNVVKGFEEYPKFSDRIFQVFLLGLETVAPYSKINTLSNEGMIDFVRNNSRDLSYPIDGVVGRFNDVDYGNSLGETDHHSKAAYAFKFYDEEYETKLQSIEWGIGRTGIITPVAIFTPIDVEGSVVERASLHNLTIMRRTLKGCGFKNQRIAISKRNMIIPQIEWAEDNANREKEFIVPEFCPCCGESLTISKENDSEFLYCGNDKCSDKIINRLDFFVGKKGLDIKGLSEATLDKLIKNGWINELSDIFKLKDHREEWIKKPGFGPKSVDKILEAIEDGRNCTFEKFICAIGIPLIGSVASKELYKHFYNFDGFLSAINNEFKFYMLPGFGEEMYKAIMTFDYTEAIEASKYINFYDNYVEPESQSLDGYTFVITGKLNHYSNRESLKKYIEDNGGKVASSVSKNTSYLINNDNTSNSAKNLKAKELNITIITEEDFVKMINTKI